MILMAIPMDSLLCFLIDESEVGRLSRRILGKHMCGVYIFCICHHTLITSFQYIIESTFTQIVHLWIMAWINRWKNLLKVVQHNHNAFGFNCLTLTFLSLFYYFSYFLLLMLIKSLFVCLKNYKRNEKFEYL